MVNILYVSNIDWKWIIQRPQIIALGLETRYHVKVVWGNTVFHRWKEQHNRYPKHYAKGIILPLQDKSKIIQFIYLKSMRKAMGDLDKYDLIWLSDPRQLEMVPNNFSGHIIYDCMDNYVEMADSVFSKKIVSKCEEELITKADIVFASSQYLTRRIYKKYGRDNAILIRNGVSDIKAYDVAQSSNKKDSYDLAYIGTVASWVDLDLMYKTSGDGIKYHIIGPSTNRRVDPIVDYLGVIEHQNIYETIKKWDCLIMPFKLNKIIRAVDPVKLYEYISFGKCIISIYYKEIERFSDFVYFYNNEESFFCLLNKLKKTGFPPKYTKEQQMQFLKDNSWEKRVEHIIASINSIL